MNIYFDTEFTNLTPDAKLISIGLVDDISNYFYAELPNNYQKDECSDFCKKEVLIHLGKEAKFEYDYTTFLEQLTLWLSHRPDSILICDSDKDIQQINKIFPQGLPFNIHVKKMTGYLGFKRKVLNYNKRLHKKFLRRTHHALDDAIINRLIALSFII